MKLIEKTSMEDLAFRKATIQAGCELYYKMTALTGRLPNNCWSKIIQNLGSPQWMKRHHLYNEIKRKRLQKPASEVQPKELKHRTTSIITKSNDDVSEASTLDEFVKVIITTNHDDQSAVSALTECGPEERQSHRHSSCKPKTCNKRDLNKIKKRLYASPAKESTKHTITIKKLSSDAN